VNAGAPACAAALALAGGACVSATYQREIEHEPIARARVAPLVPGASDLGDCLAALGAPLYVWEYRGDEIALAWGWRRARNWGAGVSVPLGERTSASLSYDDVGAATEGWVLFFDASGTLREKRKGKLRDIAGARGRATPAPMDTGESGDGE
jgi:hypothetical protein